MKATRTTLDLNAWGMPGSSRLRGRAIYDPLAPRKPDVRLRSAHVRSRSTVLHVGLIRTKCASG